MYGNFSKHAQKDDCSTRYAPCVCVWVIQMIIFFSWEASIASREEISASDKARMCISRETLEGLKFTGNCEINILNQYHACSSHTVEAFVELTRYLLSQPGVSEKLTQDTVECLFGRQRQRGGYNDNPNVQGFLYGLNSLRVQGSSAVKVLRGNSRRRKESTPLVVDNTPIPKRTQISDIIIMLYLLV